MSTVGRRIFSDSASLSSSSVSDTFWKEGHSVQFYQNDSFLLERLSRFIGAAVLAGDSALVIATEAHREALEQRLTSNGLDLSVPAEQGRLLFLDAENTLAKILVDGQPDGARFEQVVGGAIAQLASAAGESHRVAAFGEMAALLWGAGKPEAALQLEHLWNQPAGKYALQLHHAYPLELFSQTKDRIGFDRICALHSQVDPAERYTQLQTEAATAQHLLAAIVESSDDAIASKDLNGIVTSWNESAERLFGYKASEIIGKPITTIIPPELQDDEPLILAKIRAGERIAHFQTVRLRKDGERIDVSLTISPVRDDKGNIVGAAKIVRDITDNKKMELALRTTEKLAAAGRLAATVAHEINNPLEAVTNLVYLANYDLPDSMKVSRHLELASRELERVAHIARQTLGFYRDTSAPVRFSLTETLDDVVSLYERRLESRGITVLKQYETRMEITSLAGEIRQAFSNLITNAIDAMPEGGSLVIRVSRSYEWSNSQVHGVRVTIVDSGCGIPEQHRKNLFQPFFTTKKDVGTGLGLWITRSIVEKNGGTIRLKSSTGPVKHGTAFSIFLPLDESALAAA